ncbi:hypothetical protein GCM10008938_31010 [Deinococcus roseus]|uniref:Uncharacterized protein n=1 Tax=Deinococcus roseus TaxID=392414 RepID=A0ABQ2D347_9DEIO|nr:hypothetical protein GCM10008938_31010 [Deinococcus roseus]
MDLERHPNRGKLEVKEVVLKGPSGLLDFLVYVHQQDSLRFQVKFHLIAAVVASPFASDIRWRAAGNQLNSQNK